MPISLTHLDPSAVTLSPAEIRRYSRQLLVPEIGLAGQKRLKSAAVLIVGGGGLGSAAGLYLTAAGVGRLGLIDADTVEISNLHRQVLHGTSNIGQPKAESATARLRDINPEIEISAYVQQFTPANALDIARPYDVIVDASDNFPTRYLVNDVCVLLDKPEVYGSVYRLEGQATVFYASHGPCYRCLFPNPPPPAAVPTCEQGGVLGVLPGIIGVLQAVEVLKLILGIGDSLLGRLLICDAGLAKFEEVKLRPNPACAACSAQATLHHLLDDYAAFCGAAGSKQAADELTPQEPAEHLKHGPPGA